MKRGSWRLFCATLLLVGLCQGGGALGGGVEESSQIKDTVTKDTMEKDKKTTEGGEEAKSQTAAQEVAKKKSVRAAKAVSQGDVDAVLTSVSKFRFEIREHDIGLPHKVWCLPSNKPLVCIVVIFKNAGAMNVLARHPSLPNFLAPMLQRGAGRYDAYEIQGLLYDAYGSLDCSVEDDDIVVRLWAPYENIGRVLDLGILSLLQPKFPSKYFDKIRKDLMIAVEESRQDPQAVLRDAYRRRFYPAGHPYFRTLDTVADDLKHVRVKDLKEWMGVFSQQNAQVIILGPRGQEDEIVQRVKEALLRLSAQPKRPLVTSWTPPAQQENLREVQVEFEAPQSLVLAHLPGFAVGDPQYYAKLTAMFAVGGMGLNSLMFRKIRGDHGLAYSCHGNGVMKKFDTHLGFQLGTRSESVAKAKEIFLKMLQDVAAKGISRQDFELAKSIMIGQSVTSMDSVMEMANWVSYLRKLGLSVPEVLNYFQKIAHLSFAEVQQACRDLFSDVSKCCFVVVGRNQGV